MTNRQVLRRNHESQVCAVQGGYVPVSEGTAACAKCKECPDSFHRVVCTITEGGGICVECEKCSDASEVRVDCMNREGHNNEHGICRKREFTVRNPY